MSDAKQRLEQIRHELLILHKAIVESERVTYEAAIGPIQSPNHFLQLLTRDPWFAWLQPLSQLIVSIDEALEEKAPLTVERVEAFVKATHTLITPAETSEGFARHYYDALQGDPDVVLAHADLRRLLGPRPTPSQPPPV